MASETNLSITGAKRLRQDAKFKDDFVAKLQHDINSDAQGADQWLSQKQKAYKRRYQQGSKRPVNFPWPNASNFDYPGSEIEIDNAKPGLINIALGGRRIIDAVPLSADAQGRATNAGITMEYLLRYRMGERGQPDLYKQTNYSAESFLQHGLSYDKVYYSYLVEQRREKYTRETLPDNLKLIQVVDAVSEQEQQEYMQNAGILLIARDQFGQFTEQIEEVIVSTLNLDLENREDRIAANQVLQFIKANNPDAELDLIVTQVIEDCPRIVNCDIESIIIPSGTKSLQSASRITHDMWFTEADLRRRSFTGQWDAASVNEVLESSQSNRRTGDIDNNRLYTAMRRRSETDYEVDRDDARFKISEVYCYKMNAQKVPVPVVVTMERQMGMVLRAVEYDYAHGLWPFVESTYEMNEQSIQSSRGIPEKISGLEKHMSSMMRAELNGLMMATSQSFTYRQNSGINPQKLRWLPHMMIPVQRHDDLMPIQTNSSVLALERPMLLMQNLITKMTGGRLNTTTNEMRQDRPPTATQVGEQSLASQSSNGLRGMYFQTGRAAIYRQFWALWRQFGPDKFTAMVTDEPLRELSQHEIRGDFQMVPVGTVADMDPDFRLQQSFQILDLMMKGKQYLDQDARFSADIVQAIKEVMDRMDPTTSMRLLKRRSPEEMQQFLEQQQQAAQRANQLAETARALVENAPVDPEDAEVLLREIKKLSPHDGLQNIIEGASQQQRAAENAQALAQGAV